MRTNASGLTRSRIHCPATTPRPAGTSASTEAPSRASGRAPSRASAIPSAVAAASTGSSFGPAITDANGAGISGTFTTSTSSFPSGNGLAGSTFDFYFNVLPGDENQNSLVNASDTAAAKAELNLRTTSTGYNPLADYNGHTDSYWAYDDATQAGLPASVQGWRPGTGTVAQATTFAYNSSLIQFVAAILLPVPYVILGPGPTLNTLGKDSSGRPLITISGHRVYPTSGHLNMVTVSYQGGPGDEFDVFTALRAWLDRSEAVVPESELFPPGQSQQQVQQADQEQMTSSQQTATAAALHQLGIGYKTVAPSSRR